MEIVKKGKEWNKEKRRRGEREKEKDRRLKKRESDKKEWQEEGRVGVEFKCFTEEPFIVVLIHEKKEDQSQGRVRESERVYGL